MKLDEKEASLAAVLVGELLWVRHVTGFLMDYHGYYMISICKYITTDYYKVIF